MTAVNSSKSLVLLETTIRQDKEGRFCLNDLHRAAGGEQRHQPSNWLRLQQTVDLIEELSVPQIRGTETINHLAPINKVRGFTEDQGTFVVKELVYSYAMWISPSFHLQVIRAYDALVTGAQSQPQPEELNPLTLGRWWDVGMKIAKACRLKGNQTVLSADRLVKQKLGVSALALIGQSHLESETQALHYTPTEIGQMLNPPLSARRVNQALAANGLQERIADRWVPTTRGQTHALVLDTGKRHNDGTPVEQVKWAADVVSVMSRREFV